MVTTRVVRGERVTPSGAGEAVDGGLEGRGALEVQAQFEALTARAVEIRVGPSPLARTFIRQGLVGAPTTRTAWRGPAQASSLEEDLRAMVAAHTSDRLESRVAALERWVRDHDVSPVSRGASAP
jgi:hypothetical protein